MKSIALLFSLSLALASSGCGQEVEWFINKPKSFSKEAISNDVWHWYHMDALEPVAIQRVEWNTKPVVGNKRWGYMIYYQCHIKDSALVQSVKQAANKWEKYSGLPAWAKHIPTWWTPEFVFSPETAVKIAGVQGLAFGKVLGDQVFVFCLKNPLDDAILHETK